MAMKYHATLDFGYGSKQIKFTAVDVDRLMARLNKEVEKEEQRSKDERRYTWTEFEFKAEVR